MNKTILYYSNNVIDDTILNNTVINLLLESNLPIFTVTKSSKIQFGFRNKVYNGVDSHISILSQIKLGLESIKTETVFFAEHDVLYPKSHFMLDSSQVAVNTNCWGLSPAGFYKYHYNNYPLSCIFGNRFLLLEAINDKLVNWKNKNRYIEPGKDDATIVTNESGKDPVLSISHNLNFTHWVPSSKKRGYLKYWGNYIKLRRRLEL